MQMVRQDHGRFDHEGVPRAHLTKRRSQLVNMIIQQREPAIGQIDIEEKTASGQGLRQLW
jgi:hypothetical protein